MGLYRGKEEGKRSVIICFRGSCNISPKYDTRPYSVDILANSHHGQPTSSQYLLSSCELRAANGFMPRFEVSTKPERFVIT